MSDHQFEFAYSTDDALGPLCTCGQPLSKHVQFKVGDKVIIKGRRGVYTVQSNVGVPGDGSVLLYGGDKNPNGKQGYRSVMPDRLERVKRK